jgi:hypothetical protein
MAGRNDGGSAPNHACGNSDAAAKWADPKVAAQALLSGAVPFVADQVIARPPIGVEPRNAAPALESTKPAAPTGASRWDDLKLAAQLLTDTSGCSVTDTFTAYAQARRLTLEEAAAALEAWDPAKHPRGAFPQNRGW